MPNLLTPILIFIYLLLFVFWLYRPVLNGPFIYDDLILWLHSAPLLNYLKSPDPNPLSIFISTFLDHLPHPSRWLGYWHSRPLTYLSYQLDARWSGFRTRQWHSTSILLHWVAACAVYQLSLVWLTPFYALLSALIFAAHPMSVMAVAYISGRSSLLCGTLILVSLMSVSSHLYVAATIVGLLAFFAKPEAVLLPILIGALLWTR